MNLYLVVSERLQPWSRMEDEYCIAELVVARNHSQARYLAWQNDLDSFPLWGHTKIAEMPKMAVRLKKYDVPGPARIASYEEDYQRPFCPEPAISQLWELGAAPHIGL